MIYNFGINDSDYKVRSGNWMCPLFSIWRNMLMRCYSTKYQQRFPSYKGCQVNHVWSSFMSFKSWSDNLIWKNNQLDKDILGDGKLYSPMTCCFVPGWLNTLIITEYSHHGNLPRGVYKAKNRFECQIKKFGKRVYLGSFGCPEEAHRMYLSARADYVRQALQGYPNQQVKNAVIKKFGERK